MTDEMMVLVNKMAWLRYEQDWRDYRAGLTSDPPRPPLQLGRHIDTLPREINATADPHRMLSTKFDRLRHR